MKTLADFSFEEALERYLDGKRAAFISDYGLEAMPALIWQCIPSDTLHVDPANEKVRSALQEGANNIDNNRWWEAFRAGRPPVLVFEGLASSPRKNSIGFVTEIHEDGHFFAGIWTFPTLGEKSSMPGPAIGDFYMDAFYDAVNVAGKVYAAANYGATLFLTCTMHYANCLPLIGGYNHILAPAASRKTLRWPNRLHSLADLSSAGVAMAAQFMRIYGRNAPKS